MKTKNTNYIIYRAVNENNNKIYVGATMSSIHRRKLDHVERANRNEFTKFHSAINTFGPEAFSWEQIDTANSINEMASKEKYYILEYNSQNNGYNSDCGGGVKKNVYQYSMAEGRLVATYDSLENAAKAVNASGKSISNACLGYNFSCRGFFWSYDCTESLDVKKDQRKKEVVQFTLDGSLIANYDSVSDASRITGISKTCISRCCRGERRQTGGFQWKYA